MGSDSAVVGSAFIFIGEVLVSAALIFLVFKIKYFIPVQGNGASDSNPYQTSRPRKVIPLLLGSVSCARTPPAARRTAQISVEAMRRRPNTSPSRDDDDYFVLFPPRCVQALEHS